MTPVPDQPHPQDDPGPDDEQPDDEQPEGQQPDLQAMLEQLLGGAGTDPQMAEALKSMGLDKMDPATMGMVQAQIQAMFSAPDEGPYNAELAGDAARKTVAATGDATVGPSTRQDVEQVVQVATLWLDPVTELDAPSGGARALSRAEWVEQTMPVWRQLTEPVAAGVGAAIHSVMTEQMGALGDADDPAAAAGMPQIPGMPAGMNPAAMMGQMEPMLRKMSGAMFGMQVGQAVGTLAGELVSGTEVGLPLVPDEAVAMLPANVAAFAEGLGVDPGEVHLYLAVREAARVRLFAEVPWLGPQLIAAVQEYARDISIDTEGIESAMRSVDPSDPEAMQEALTGSLFTPEPSEAQKAALGRLETYLALVEGWVDVVSDKATTPHLPNAAALGEAVRRRRATGGPAEKVFSSLVGLELRPRRLRDAANLWAALESAGGQAARDGAWAHPDMAPTGADLDDPLGYVERARARGDEGDDMDAALAKLLRGDDES